jgi:hypothetical protein
MTNSTRLGIAIATVTVGLIVFIMLSGSGERSRVVQAPPTTQSSLAVRSSAPIPRASVVEPTMTPEATQRPIPPVEPAPNDDLALAGRNGVPGLLGCGAGFTFTFDATFAPTGAETKVGPEFDALREFFRINIANGDDQLGSRPRARDVARDEAGVAFLIDRADPGPWGDDGGPYLYANFKKVADAWKWAGSGDCQPRAESPPGYRPATWTLDPAHSKPKSSSRVLHLLVHEQACASGRDASGRIGPAYVIVDAFEIHVEILVQALPEGGDCQMTPLTPARLSLPERVGDRTLRDVNAHLLTGTGG